ncbi:MAG: heparinase II/III-family protein [Acidobacteriia bacterium]|nr:heparinase II/III-family protein [Terriglobia bacterium]
MPAMAMRPPAGTRSRQLLSSLWTPERLVRVLAPADDWKPFPPASARDGWQALPSAVRESLLSAGARHKGSPWEPIPATLFLEFVRKGNRSDFEHVQFERRTQLRELVVAECVEGKRRFLDDIANGIWATCEETFWGVPAHLDMQKRGTGLPDVTEPVIDLFAAETASLIAWSIYLCGTQLDTVHPLVRDRGVFEVERRILAPYREREDFWWMGLGDGAAPRVNNWNPWINSNCLTCTLLMDRNPERRARTVYKVMRSLDRFLDSYGADGGCDEGPSYWGRAGASLFDCLELLYSSTAGQAEFYSLPLVREIGRYIYRAHICDDWFLNIGDGPARMQPDGRLVFRCGRRIDDSKLQRLGAYFGQRQSTDPEDEKSIGRQLATLFDSETLGQAAPGQPLVRDVWLPDLQVMTGRRREGSRDGFYLAAQGGHNGKSHNHNDVGNFVVYADGRPALIDVGVETYTAKTFSNERYQIWTMQSGYHNLPTVNGVMQAPGQEYAARDVTYQADDAGATFRLDIAAAYPPEAGLVHWTRLLRLDRVKNQIELRDAWQLNKPGGRFSLSLMTACNVTQPGSGELLLAGGPLSPTTVRLLFDANLVFAVEEIAADDPRLRSVWGGPLRRILLKAENLPARGEQAIRILQV